MVVLMETWLNDVEFAAAEERGDVFSTKRPDEEAEVEVSELVNYIPSFCSYVPSHP